MYQIQRGNANVYKTGKRTVGENVRDRKGRMDLDSGKITGGEQTAKFFDVALR
jgi:hypothetical protein